MIEGNQGKKALLSIIGIAILVVAVVGVTFAFFTYSRTGATNNVITTGKVSFVFADNSFITLTNHFPISTSDGLALSGTNNVCTFTVTGSTSTGTLNYAVWAIDGDSATTLNLTGSTTKFQNSEVFVNITSTDVTGIAFTPSTGIGGSSAAAISTLPTTANNVGTVPANAHLLGTGTVTARSDATRSFTVKMWVDSSVVTVGETGATYTPGQYGTLYYTMKIAVTAAQ